MPQTGVQTRNNLESELKSPKPTKQSKTKSLKVKLKEKYIRCQLSGDFQKVLKSQTGRHKRRSLVSPLSAEMLAGELPDGGRKYMPDLANLFSHVLVDVSSVKALCLRWYPRGLNVEVDTILEIACVITDGSLTKLVEGPDIVISQPKECLDNMGEWCQEHHGASGLTGKVLESTISIEEAEKQVYLL
ncbi:unnamed protein product [Cuscuta europaea]|uniref:Exonuclease domain-containing protein n=1 Tax=Cuscuta europaea TaxID=41803 RepID=A0A9P0ZC28_CUSEU|nr:unnamed protein product [Cuscuta europaea]